MSRLEKDYLTSPTYHRSSPNLYQPNDVVGGVVTGVSVCLSLLLTFFYGGPLHLFTRSLFALQLTKFTNMD